MKILWWIKILLILGIGGCIWYLLYYANNLKWEWAGWIVLGILFFVLPIYLITWWLITIWGIYDILGKNDKKPIITFPSKEWKLLKIFLEIISFITITLLLIKIVWWYVSYTINIWNGTSYEWYIYLLVSILILAIYKKLKKYLILLTIFQSALLWYITVGRALINL